MVWLLEWKKVLRVKKKWDRWWWNQRFDGSGSGRDWRLLEEEKWVFFLPSPISVSFLLKARRDMSSLSVVPSFNRSSFFIDIVSNPSVLFHEMGSRLIFISIEHSSSLSKTISQLRPGWFGKTRLYFMLILWPTNPFLASIESRNCSFHPWIPCSASR